MSARTREPSGPSQIEVPWAEPGKITSCLSVAPAQRSGSALEKAHTGRRPDGSLVYSFRGLLAELATLTKNTVRLPGSEVAFEKLALPTPIQTEALRLLGLSPSP
jgi:hypothetical protein